MKIINMATHDPRDFGSTKRDGKRRVRYVDITYNPNSPNLRRLKIVSLMGYSHIRPVKRCK